MSIAFSDLYAPVASPRAQSASNGSVKAQGAISQSVSGSFQAEGNPALTFVALVALVLFLYAYGAD